MTPPPQPTLSPRERAGSAQRDRAGNAQRERVLVEDGGERVGSGG